ncbi:MAG: efflux RND transporter periplasmic adaptor subunit [Gemmatimonadaceae bacterium]
MNMHSHLVARTSLLLAVVAGCTTPRPDAGATATARMPGNAYTVKDTTVQSVFEATGTATPVRQATLSTKLMGSVLEVLVQEGDAVIAGQALVRIDSRDIAAKQSQVAASIADAEAMHRDAQVQAGRMRALYADSAATRAQLDVAETGLARSEAGMHAARGAAAELGAMGSYAVIRAPFAGIVTKRFVDPGAFASPGAPLVAVQDGVRLRITASATPDAARGLRRGQSLDATIEGRTLGAIVEGIVPAGAGNLYTINAIVANPGGHILPGSTATLLLPLGTRRALVVPASAVMRQGDLTGVTLRTAEGDATRWVRLGRTAGSAVEIDAGLRAGDQVVVPAAGAPTTGAGS